MNEKDFDKLSNAYLSAQERVYFKDRVFDDELNEIFQAYTNLPDTVADEFKQIIIKNISTFNEFSDEKITLVSFLQSRCNYYCDCLKNLHVFSVNKIDF